MRNKFTSALKTENSLANIDEHLEVDYVPNRKKNYLPQRLIFTNSSYSRVEQRLFEIFINQINYETIDSSRGLIVKVPITKVREFIERKQILKVTGMMASRTMTLFNLTHDILKFEHIPVFRKISYDEETGYLEFTSAPELSPYLADLVIEKNKYSSYDFKTIMSFKSTYTSIMYRLINLHTSHNRYTFLYSIDEIRKILEIKDSLYPNLNNLKKRVLMPVQEELASMKIPIYLEFSHVGGKQRNVTHLQFTVKTSFDFNQEAQKEFLEAVVINPQGVYAKIEEILIKEYNFRENHRNEILQRKELRDMFITLHIEFENDLHPKVKNRTAYILTCLGLVSKKRK
jgi:hypothetical protein